MGGGRRYSHSPPIIIIIIHSNLPLFFFFNSTPIMDRFPILFLLATLITLASGARHDILRLPSEASTFFKAPGGDQNDEGTRWAVLIAGSNGYWNYRHQVTFLISPLLTLQFFPQFLCLLGRT